MSDLHAIWQSSYFRFELRLPRMARPQWRWPDVTVPSDSPAGPLQTLDQLVRPSAARACYALPRHRRYASNTFLVVHILCERQQQRKRKVSSCSPKEGQTTLGVTDTAEPCSWSITPQNILSLQDTGQGCAGFVQWLDTSRPLSLTRCCSSCLLGADCHSQMLWKGSSIQAKSCSSDVLIWWSCRQRVLWQHPSAMKS